MLVKLILYIRNKQVDQIELQFPDFGNISFKKRTELREEFIKWQGVQLKINNDKATENHSWEIILFIETPEIKEPYYVTILNEINRGE